MMGAENLDTKRWVHPHIGMHGHKVVILPKITVEWAEFGTPSSLAKQIDSFGKRKAYAKWKAANQSKLLHRRCQS